MRQFYRHRAVPAHRQHRLNDESRTAVKSRSFRTVAWFPWSVPLLTQSVLALTSDVALTDTRGGE